MSLEEKKYYAIFSKPNCPYCSYAKHLSVLNTLDFEVIEEESDEERKTILLEIREVYKTNHNTFPAIVEFIYTGEKNSPTITKMNFIGGATEFAEHLTKNGYIVSKV